MSVQGKRPGGLTALGVISIVFAVLGIFSVIMLVVFLAVGNILPDPPEGMSPEEVEDYEKSRAVIDDMANWDWLLPYTILSAINTVLLFIAGIGYIKMKRVMGRHMGNAYAVTGLILLAISAFTAPKTPGSDFGLIIGMILPVLTLFLVNLTFKDDLVR